MSPEGFGDVALLIGAAVFSQICFVTATTTVYSGSSSISSSYSTCTGTVGYISDGDCDTSNNNALCGYDGGDCCECTCEDSAFSCSINSFDTCIDPSAPTACNSSGSTSGFPTSGTGASSENLSSSSSGCNVLWISNGLCNGVNNNEACAYDGGDCCECTCDDGDYDCSTSNDDCIDPDAICHGTSVDDPTSESSTVSDSSTSSSYTTFNGCVLTWISDGYCDAGNNNENCGYDGGDCCACTCDDGSIFDCASNGYDCVDPDAWCTETSYGDEESGTETTSSPVEAGADCMPESISDGYCDKENNNEDCFYDGGDCCECTCVNGVKHNCVQGKFDCLDPDADCTDDSSLADSEDASEDDGKWLDAAWEIVVTVVGTLCAAAVVSLFACMWKRKYCQPPVEVHTAVPAVQIRPPMYVPGYA